MAKRTPTQVYADLRAAGASDEAARILTEIAGAESNWDDAALGDVNLQNNTWGPSFGEFQIRTLKADTGTGTDRDISMLAGDDAAQAAAAWEISKQGTDFSPWSTYTNRAYLGEQAAVNAAIQAPAASSSSTGSTSATPASFVGSLLGGTLGGVRQIVIEAAVGILGLTLIGLGIAHFAQPVTSKVKAVGEKAAGTAAKAAVLA